MKALFFALAFSFITPAFAGSQLEEAPAVASDKQQLADDKKEAKKKNKEGLALLKKKQYFEASMSFEEAISLNPENAHYYNQYGLALLKSGDPYYAIEQFKMALELGLNKDFVWNNLGMAYEHTNQLDDARNSYMRASQKGNVAAAKNYERIKFVKSLNIDFSEGLGCGGEEDPGLILTPSPEVMPETAPEATPEAAPQTPALNPNNAWLKLL
jgi:tetratricopeptide (TPR) repeat protein